jgi:hypothetical protein
VDARAKKQPPYKPTFPSRDRQEAGVPRRRKNTSTNQPTPRLKFPLSETDHEKDSIGSAPAEK